MTKPSLALALLAALCSTAVADEVVLRNGATFTGAVREEGDRVIVEMDLGSMSFKKVDVKSISRGEDVVKVFETKAAQAADNRERVQVAMWGREKGLGRRADDLLQKVIQSDPDQAEARKALGYQRVDGQWLKDDALQVSRGMLKVDGKWIPKEEAQRQADRQEAARSEADRIALEKRIADQVHEQEMLKLALERERIEMEKRDAEYRRDHPYLYTGPIWSEGPMVVPQSRPVVLPPTAPTTQAPAARGLPPTPPTVLPISPPWQRPVTRSSQPRSYYEKKDEEERQKGR